MPNSTRRTPTASTVGVLPHDVALHLCETTSTNDTTFCAYRKLGEGRNGDCQTMLTSRQRIAILARIVRVLRRKVQQ
jgi:hypothetical protein